MLSNRMSRLIILLLFSSALLVGCKDGAPPPVSTGAFAPAVSPSASATADMDAILASGELIVATFNGPDTYYEYQGKPFGLQYALAADFARREGLRLRLETATDTLQLLQLLRNGEADVVALPLPLALIRAEGLLAAGATDKSVSRSWAVRTDAPALADALNSWNAANPLVAVEKHEAERNRERRQVKRHARAPYLSRQKGIISTYDEDFKKAAAVTGWDWRLIAAQCYQESAFDPNALSWAGARGLMQIMPATGETLGLTADELYVPTKNIHAAAQYITRLNATFTDISSAEERVKFVLAAYNGGAGHVRDAMALAEKYGKNPRSWEQVAPFVLRLSDPAYYRDPVVKYGYMIGSETYAYVTAVLDRFRGYGGRVATDPAASTPARPSCKPNRFSGEYKILSPEELQAEKPTINNEE